MPRYQVNEAITYLHLDTVKNNPYIGAPQEDEAIPPYEAIKDKLPRPIWDGHGEALRCYDYAWKTAFGNLHRPLPGSRFVTNFIDSAFSDHLFMWDSVFCTMYGKYAAHVFDFQKTLDNFYAHQHHDGFICRQICESQPGEMFTRFDPSATGPDVMGWGEWEYYCQNGDKERLSKVFYPLLAYHQWMQQFHTWQNGTYWSSGWGCGMDNQPRNHGTAGELQNYTNCHMSWIDACIQAVLSGKILVKIAEELHINEPAMVEIEQEITELSAYINDRMWDDEVAFYFDQYRDGSLSDVKSVGAYWALLADIIPADRLRRFVQHLDNEKEFKRPHRVPTLSADHPDYQKGGQYWRGGVWAPTNYMVLKGLDKNGYQSLAYDIACSSVENVTKVFSDTGTLWENYAPEMAEKGETANPNFVGWSALFPISILLEYVMGLRPQAMEQKIVWYVNLTERHGVEKYPLGDTTVDLLCEARASANEEPAVTVKADHPVTVEIHWGDKVKVIKA